MMTSHFYWVGAIPAMVFVAIFMMPFYYGSRARSVPEYLKLRFDEKTRGFNAISFAVMTIFSSGISMYAMGKLFNLLLGWNFNLSMLLAAALVVQRAMAANSMSAARRTPLIAAVPKMFFPFLVILPGMIALALGGKAGAQAPQARPALVRQVAWHGETPSSVAAEAPAQPAEE